MKTVVEVNKQKLEAQIAEAVTEQLTFGPFPGNDSEFPAGQVGNMRVTVVVSRIQLGDSAEECDESITGHFSEYAAPTPVDEVPITAANHPSHDIGVPENCGCKGELGTCIICDQGLDMCILCGKVEAELVDPCPAASNTEGTF